MRKRFVSVDRATPQMFPARIDDYLPEDHLARFVVDIVEQLDLRGLVEAYSGRGSSAYHPAMMVALLFYGYATGTFSSRKLERATYDSIAYRYICANRNPDHDSINSFRKRFMKEPEGGPGDKDQVNLVDEDSRIMQTSGGFEQSYNAQAGVEVESKLIVTRHVTQNTNDKREIEPTLEQLGDQKRLLGEAENLLADAGYFSRGNVEACGRKGVKPFISTNRERHNERFWERFGQGEQEDSGEPVSAVEDMKRRMKTSEGKGLYAKRKSTIEPAFGVIKHVMGFRQFLLRGVGVVQGEWNLVCVGYNLKKMYALRG